MTAGGGQGGSFSYLEEGHIGSGGSDDGGGGSGDWSLWCGHPRQGRPGIGWGYMDRR